MENENQPNEEFEQANEEQAVAEEPVLKESVETEEPVEETEPEEVEESVETEEPVEETDTSEEDELAALEAEIAELEAKEVSTPEEPVEIPEPVVEVAEPVVIEKPIEQWTLEEVKAFICGDVKKTSTITEKEVVERGRTFTFKVDARHTEWGFKDVFNWLKSGELPTQTSGGFYHNDPKRASKHAKAWTRDELVDFLKGELKASLKAPEEELMDVVVINWRLPVEWTESEIKGYVLRNIQPQKTESGFWLNDRVRAKKPATYWSKSELIAFVRGELPATDVATEAALYDAVRDCFSVGRDYSEERLTQLLVDYKEEPLPMSLQFVEHNLAQYAAGMGKGVMVNEEGAAGFQTLLYHTMGRVLRLEGRQFVDGWTMILDFANKHRTTMFDERSSYRGVSVIKLADRDRKNFEQLLNLVVKTSDPATRYNQAQNTNFTVALRGITDESVRQRVLSYYQVD
jgi:hypothetical protein